MLKWHLVSWIREIIVGWLQSLTFCLFSVDFFRYHRLLQLWTCWHLPYRENWHRFDDRDLPNCIFYSIFFHILWFYLLVWWLNVSVILFLLHTIWHLQVGRTFVYKIRAQLGIFKRLMWVRCALLSSWQCELLCWPTWFREYGSFLVHDLAQKLLKLHIIAI